MLYDAWWNLGYRLGAMAKKRGGRKFLDESVAEANKRIGTIKGHDEAISTVKAFKGNKKADARTIRALTLWP
jgi:hypothetical protein